MVMICRFKIIQLSITKYYTQQIHISIEDIYSGWENDPKKRTEFTAAVDE